jgi:Leucine-rich repeat (LRR) protein
MKIKKWKQLQQKKETIISGIILRLKIIDASNNDLVVVESGSFINMSGVSTIKLAFFYHNKLKHIQDNAFRGLQSLNLLDLSHNQLETVTAKSWNGLRKLLYLVIGYNNLHNVLQDMSKETIPLLHALVLEHNPSHSLN